MCWTNLYPLNGIFFVVCASVWNTYLLFIPLLLECYHFILDEKASRFMNFAQLSTGQGCLMSFLNALHFKWVKKYCLILQEMEQKCSSLHCDFTQTVKIEAMCQTVAASLPLKTTQIEWDSDRDLPLPRDDTSALVSDIKWFEVVCQPGGRYCVEFII